MSTSQGGCARCPGGGEFGFPLVNGCSLERPTLALWLAIKERIDVLQIPFQWAGSVAHTHSLSGVTEANVLGTAYRYENDNYSLTNAVRDFLYWFLNEYLRNEGNSATAYFSNYKLYMLDDLSDLDAVRAVTYDQFQAWLENWLGITLSELNGIVSVPKGLSSTYGATIAQALINRLRFTSTRGYQQFHQKGNRYSWRVTGRVHGATQREAFANAWNALLSTDWSSYTLTGDADTGVDVLNVPPVGTFGTYVNYGIDYNLSGNPRYCSYFQSWLREGDGIAYPSAHYDGSQITSYEPGSAIFCFNVWPTSRQHNPWHAPRLQAV